MRKPQMAANWDEKHLTEKELEARAVEMNRRRGKILVIGNHFKPLCLLEANYLKYLLLIRPGTSYRC